MLIQICVKRGVIVSLGKLDVWIEWRTYLGVS